MNKEKRDWPSIISIVLSLILSLTAIGKSWGAAGADVSGLKDQIVIIQADLKSAKDDVQLLKTDRAVTGVVEQNIFEKLDQINKRLDAIDNKIDKLQEGRRGGTNQEVKP